MTETTFDQLRILLERLAAGDLSAREHLLTLTMEKFRKVASKMLHYKFPDVGEHEQTDDIMQNVMMRLIKSWDKTTTDDLGQPLSDPIVYYTRVSRLMREVFLDLVRHHFGPNKGGKNKPRPLDPGTGSESGLKIDIGQETYNPESLAFYTEFHNAVSSLPDPLRMVVDMHWYQELTHQEIGEKIGLTEHGVRKRWVEARSLLTDRLGKNPFQALTWAV